MMKRGRPPPISDASIMEFITKGAKKNHLRDHGKRSLRMTKHVWSIGCKINI